MPSSSSGVAPRFVRTHDAAAFLGLSGRTLEKHRCTGTGPVFRKLGGRVVYAIEDLEAWAAGAQTQLDVRSRPTAAASRCGTAASHAGTRALSGSGRMRRAIDDQQLELFRARSGDMALRDAQDLMSWPFFSLAKTRRVQPIDFRMGEVSIRVEAAPEHGMATVWDADVLIWAASQIVDARDRGLRTSRLMAATPYEILAFIGRSDSLRDHERLKAGLDRLQSTTVATSTRQPTERRRHRFSWINEWKERIDAQGPAKGIELILPDWFYAGVMMDALVLTIDRAYFGLTGGLERWL